ncbi:MAG: hypothetical protein M9887_03130 [Chitinophagales bacterium]|nr:hypothetical protein [Chitinophagales bacterium]
MLRKLLSGFLITAFVAPIYAQTDDDGTNENTAQTSVTTSLNIDETADEQADSIVEYPFGLDSLEYAIFQDMTAKRPEGKGWYIEFDAGWGMPFMPVNKRSPLQEIGDKDWYQRPGQNVLRVSSNFGTNGGGWAGNFTVGHMFNKNIGLDFTGTLAKHPEGLDARIDIPGYFAQQRTTTTALYIAPHLVLKTTKGKFGVTSKVGFFAPVYGATMSKAQIRDRNGRMLQTLLGMPIEPLGGGLAKIDFDAKLKTEYHPTLGISSSISLDYILGPNLKIFARARVAAYTISLRETNFKELTMKTEILGIPIDELGPLRTNINDVSEAPTFLKKITYHKTLTEANNTARYGGKVDLDKPMEELGIKYNASSLYFSIGFTWQFDGKWDTRGVKKAKKEAAKIRAAK